MMLRVPLLASGAAKCGGIGVKPLICLRASAAAKCGGVHAKPLFSLRPSVRRSLPLLEEGVPPPEWGTLLGVKMIAGHVRSRPAVAGPLGMGGRSKSDPGRGPDPWGFTHRFFIRSAEFLVGRRAAAGWCRPPAVNEPDKYSRYINRIRAGTGADAWPAAVQLSQSAGSNRHYFGEADAGPRSRFGQHVR